MAEGTVVADPNCDCRQTMGETITRDCPVHRGAEEVPTMNGLRKLLADAHNWEKLAEVPIIE